MLNSFFKVCSVKCVLSNDAWVSCIFLHRFARKANSVLSPYKVTVNFLAQYPIGLDLLNRASVHCKSTLGDGDFGAVGVVFSCPFRLS